MKTILFNIGKLYTLNHESLPLYHDALKETEMLEDAYVVIKDDKIEAYGTGDYSKYVDDNTELFDVEGQIVLPGLVDAHTHLVFGGSREHEYDLKLQGVAYLDILRQGGGILNTVESTRKASFDELYDQAMHFADIMLLHGVTTVEAKTGYGLDTETELKQLKVAQMVDKDHPIEIVNTFMPAHAIPKEHKENPDVYIDMIVEEMLPELAQYKDQVKYVDIFCEDAVFNKEQSRRVLEKAQSLGFKVKIHADEVVPMGGAALAADLNALSAEHLMATSDEDMDKMANAKVMANLLPATSFNLGKDYARARMMIDKGVAVTICSDFNPGSCPNPNMQLVLQIASRGYKMTPIEVYNSAIVNGSCSLELSDKIGSIKEGKQADIVVMDAPNLEYTIYNFGANHVSHVFKDGALVVYNQEIL